MTFDEGKMAIPRHFHVITMHMFTYCFLLLFFLGLEFSLNSIINKWKKLKQQYKTHHDNQRRSGTERRKKWKFFDEMDKIHLHLCVLLIQVYTVKVQVNGILLLLGSTH